MFLRSLLFADFFDLVNSNMVEIRSQRRTLRFFRIISASCLFSSLSQAQLMQTHRKKLSESLAIWRADREFYTLWLGRSP
ncbi:Uncharacterised protein [Paenibacillus macerans]|uniref:Uncharacterized protein n=1 Tax=Paenibacillus macerans TaxID=44252 RepID=A0A090XHI4_PAEMA|nr:hypothetical protein DJ90_5618 [Paenibacillus macerans]SUD26007.1 Uncharacterised protein [Paenibacillus macerans]